MARGKRTSSPIALARMARAYGGTSVSGTVGARALNIRTTVVVASMGEPGRGRLPEQP